VNGCKGLKIFTKLYYWRAEDEKLSGRNSSFNEVEQINHEDQQTKGKSCEVLRWWRWVI
jgi:hypothetical protein